MLSTWIVRRFPALFVSLTLVMVGCSTSQPEPDKAPETPPSAGIAYTDHNLATAPGFPLYTDPTKGASHLMKTSAGTYYSYNSGEQPAGWVINKSEDGIHWLKLVNNGYPNGTWGKSEFWVPKVIEYKGKYYMYYCARKDASYPSASVGLAIADKPEGPFQDVGYSILDGTELEGFHVIDPKPFIDPLSGKKYLYVSKGAHYQYYHEYFKTEVTHSIIYGMELSEDMTKVIGKPIEMIRPSQEWEYKSYDRKGKTLWNEAPQVFEHNGTYYMTYSANNFTTQYYAIGVATAKSPLGPWTKQATNPVASSTATIKKTGHSTVVPSPDGSEFFTAYTTLKSGRFTSRIGFRPDGSMYINGPIKGYQEMPSGSTNYKNYAKEAAVTASSTKQGYRTQALNDGEIGIYDRLEKYEWLSDGEKEGAWVQLTWDRPHGIDTILIYDSAVRGRRLLEGHLVLNNDPNQVAANIQFPIADGDPAVVRFEQVQQISSLKFIVDKLLDDDGTAGLSEISVLGLKE
jgi:GH43 family beta-xylosidase